MIPEPNSLFEVGQFLEGKMILSIECMRLVLKSVVM